MDFLSVRQLDYVSFREAKLMGMQFARWLNATGGTRLVLRVLNLEKQIQHLNAELAEYVEALPDDGPESDEISDEMGARLDRMVAEFDKLMSRCKIYPHLINVEFSEDGLEFRWDLVSASRKPLKPWPGAHPKTTLDDLDALLCIVRLGQVGYLSRLKQCHCKQWYFERLRWQQFCSGKCRQRMFSKSEKFKEHRRDYMRKYYKLKMSGLVK